MGFLSKLLGRPEPDPIPGREKDSRQNAPDRKSPGAAPAGRSWGPDMPAEENQFNYPGTYLEYFEHIFREDFPSCAYQLSPGRSDKTTVCTFRQDGRHVLTVELLSETCNVRKVRQDCSDAGIPYLRFYYDHPGWWNTRSYVSGRIRAALGQ